jgi:hypothetical protein
MSCEERITTRRRGEQECGFRKATPLSGPNQTKQRIISAVPFRYGALL